MDLEFGANLRGKLFTALTGNSEADVTGKGDVRGMLMAVGGSSSKTKSGIDLTKAAAKLGVSRRTVERWVKTAATGQGQRPSPQHAKLLAGHARKAATTKAGRKAAVQVVRDRKTMARGARLAIKGSQGPLRNGKDYPRNRLTQLMIDPDAAEAMLTAYEQGGDKGFMTWATNFYDQEYLEDWGFQTVDSIEIESPYGGGWR